MSAPTIAAALVRPTGATASAPVHATTNTKG